MSKGLTRAAAALAALVALVALYALLGFFVLPRIALNLANQQLAEHATVPAQLRDLTFNPFTLELRAEGFTVGEPERAQVGFAQLQAQMAWDSLWSGALHIRTATLDAPSALVAFAKNGQLNLSSLFRPSTDEPQPAADSRPFPVRIDNLTLNGGALRFRDDRPSEPIDFAYDALNVKLKNLSTLAEDSGEMVLTATGPQGGRIDWQGTLGFAPFTSEGTLKISDGRLKLFWPYVREALPLVLKQGTLEAGAHYRLSLGERTELKLDKVSARLGPIALQAPDGRPLLKLAKFDLSQASVDVARQQVTVGKVRVTGLESWAAREPDGNLDWQRLFASPTPAPSSTAPPPPSPAPASAGQRTPSKPWQVRVEDVRARETLLHLADRSQAEPVALDIGPLDLDLRGYDSANETPFSLQLNTTVGKQGRLAATGEVSLAPLKANVQVTASDLDLRIAQPYLSPYVRLELRSGLLGGEVDVALAGTDPLVLAVKGNARVNQLHTLDTLKDRDLVKWQQMDVQGLTYLHGDGLIIDRILLEQPYARFMINEDRSTNLDDLRIPQPSTDSGQDTATAPAAASTPFGVHIGGIDVRNGSANFADLTLTPFFATAAQQLNGHIGTLDSRVPGQAEVDIEGKVDRYAPVTIKGALDPFDPMSSLDITARFRRVELTTLTPYSGKFAGYRIRKGRLNLDLHYAITQGRLKAENSVVIEQLQLGERVESPDAVDLPIRLAVALLKDTKGRIALELPVSGNLNDPQFSVMPIVWQTLRNLVLRAAQAPFKLIGGLIAGGGQADLSSVSFAPGQSELNAEARTALDALASGLKQRPQLRLEIEGTSAESSDGPLLAHQRLEREYQSTWYKILQRRGDKVPATAAELVVADADKPALLEGIYRTRLKQQPPAEWKQLDAAARTDKLRQAVLMSWTSSAGLLRVLGQQRAAAIKDYLVEHGQLSDERVYFIDTRLGNTDAQGLIPTALHLEAE